MTSISTDFYPVGAVALFGGTLPEIATGYSVTDVA